VRLHAFWHLFGSRFFFFGYHTLAPKQVTTLGCVWLGFYLLLLLPKANITTKGVGCHPKPQAKAAFA
jgi:hypothetical protein